MNITDEQIEKLLEANSYLKVFIERPTMWGDKLVMQGAVRAVDKTGEVIGQLIKERVSAKAASFNPPASEQRNLEMLRDQSTKNAYDDQNQND